MKQRKLFLGLMVATGLFAGKAMACELQDLDFASLRGSGFTKTSEHLAPPPAMSLQMSFVRDLRHCNSVRVVTLKSQRTNQIYTAIASHEDSCDGGNTFGYIVRGHNVLAENLVAAIQDSYVQCL